MSMGVEMGAPEHEAALQRFREGCERAGKPSGIPTKDAASTRQRLDEGFRFIDLNNDLRLLDLMARQTLSAVGA
jgi:2-keto-3-deoxy-L-rhamnonate aldolase RhmA